MQPTAKFRLIFDVRQVDTWKFLTRVVFVEAILTEMTEACFYHCTPTGVRCTLARQNYHYVPRGENSQFAPQFSLRVCLPLGVDGRVYGVRTAKYGPSYIHMCTYECIWYSVALVFIRNKRMKLEHVWMKKIVVQIVSVSHGAKAGESWDRLRKEESCETNR
jgi:hypothetical protein